MNAFLIKSVLIAALTLGGIWGVLGHFKNDRENETALDAARQRIAVLEAQNAGLTQDNTDLNDRIAERNQQVRDELAKAQQEITAAEADAKAARDEKKSVLERLKEARKKYQEESNNDENLRAYGDTVVPAAVLERLRSANGETRGQPEPVRTGPGDDHDLPVTTGGSAHGGGLPAVAPRW